MSTFTQPQSISDYAKAQEPITAAIREIAEKKPFFWGQSEIVIYVTLGIAIAAIILAVVAIFRNKSK